MKSPVSLVRPALVSLCLMSVSVANATAGDLIFDADFDAGTNGGTSCDTATALVGDSTYSADTVTAPNWITSFGPLLSPANDAMYVFVAGPDVEGAITPTVSNFAFAIYLIESCLAPGSEPQPIGASGTLGRGIDLAAAGVVSGHTYYVAVTGSASGGGGANGFVNFTTPPSLGSPRPR
ncbi:MAG TPA: hypothetical protein VFV97_05105 [Rhodanobacteraceae bacterium]|nr:hypothetical protein [Rhodanobacteraceae bacterium]